MKSGHRGPVKTGQRALLRVEGSGWAEHRMELSGGLVPRPSSLVGRKSGTVVHWRSEWPLGVRSDGQPVASHTGSLYQGLSWTVSLFFFSPRPPPFLTQCPTRKKTQTFSPRTSGFFSLRVLVTAMRPRWPPSPSALPPPPPLQARPCRCERSGTRPLLFFVSRLPSSSRLLKRSEVRPGSRGACESHQREQEVQRDSHLWLSPRNKSEVSHLLLETVSCSCCSSALEGARVC